MDAYSKLKKLTSYKHNYIVSRGNSAILHSLKIAKEQGFNDVYIADQGGWLTYKHYPKKLKMQLNLLKTNYGIVDEGQIKKIHKSVLLLNASPAYCCYQPFDKIIPICKQNKNLVIVDITATIGLGSFGDIMVASFGKQKPVDYGNLGLISFNAEYIKPEEEIFDDKYLCEKLDNVNNRRNKMIEIAKQIKKDLIEYEIIHKNEDGINVIAKFKNSDEYETLLKYCMEKGFECVECPKYIKVLDNAISIEVKKIDF